MQPETPSAMSEEERTQEGPLALLPEGVLDHMMSLLAAGKGGSCIRSTCRWLRSAFDRCNTRLVLRGPDGQHPDSFLARLLDLVRHSPRVSSLTLAGGPKCVTWPEVVDAGGPQLLQRLESLTLMHRPPALEGEPLDIEAVMDTCTRLLRLCHEPYLPAAYRLQPLAACGGTLRHLEVQDCSSMRDVVPLAACAALQRLVLGQCQELADLAPLAACVQLLQLQLSSSPKLHDLSPLTACVQLHTLHITDCAELTDLGPLASCAALRELNLCSCRQVSNLAPLASCVALQHLDLGHCQRVEDLRPLAACVGLQTLILSHCGVEQLGPLAACVGLQTLILQWCSKVQSLDPLASCLGLETLDLRGCEAQDMDSLAALPRLRIIQ